MSSILIRLFEKNSRYASSFHVVCDSGVYKVIFPKDDYFLVLVGVGLSEYHCIWTHKVFSSIFLRESNYPSNYDRNY